MARTNPADDGYLGTTPTTRLPEVIVIGDRAHRIHNVRVHFFTVGDVEDPEIYAAEPILKWQDSEAGKWVMERAVETPMYHRHIDHVSYGYRYAITAKLKDKDYTYWCLKYADTVDKLLR